MSDSDLLNPYDELWKQRLLRNSRHVASLGIKNFNVIFPLAKAKFPSSTRKNQDSGSEFDPGDESDCAGDLAQGPGNLTQADNDYDDTSTPLKVLALSCHCDIFFASLISCIPYATNMLLCHLLRSCSIYVSASCLNILLFICLLSHIELFIH